MQINRTTYEAFFLDYLEGKLNATEMTEVRAFAEGHPDLLAELNEMARMFGSLTIPLPVPPIKHPEKSDLHQRDWSGESELLPLEVIVFEGKSALKKSMPIQEEAGMLLLAAYAEGDLKGEEKARATQLIAAHPEWQHDLAVLRLCRVTPEPIVFEHKSGLKRKTGRAIPMVRYFAYTAAAAVVAWMIAIALPVTPHEAQVAASVRTRLPRLSVPAATERVDQEERQIPFYPNHRRAIPRDSAPSNNPMLEQDLAVQPDTLPIEFREEFPLPQPLLPEEEHIAVMQPEVSPTPDVAPSPRHAETVQTVRSFAESKAKEKLWGGEDYPEDKFLLALADREVEKRFNNENAFIEVTRVNKADEKELKVRVGKLSFSRKR